MALRRGSVRRRLGPLGAVLAAAVAAGALAGCSATYTYLTSRSSQSYLAVPHAWKVYDQKAILAATGSASTFPYLVFFDANRHPSLKDTLSPTPEPWGVLRIRDLSSSEQATFSFDSLDNELIQLDQLAQAGQAQVLGSSTLLTHGTYRGVRQEVALQDGTQTILAEEAGYVNRATTKAWALLVGCSATCFHTNLAVIDRVVQSWTVGTS